jgi:hypothetical protein
MNGLGSRVAESGLRLMIGAWLAVAATMAWASPVVLRYEAMALAAPSRYAYSYQVENLSFDDGVAWVSIDFETHLYDASSLVIRQLSAGWDGQVLAPTLDDPAQFDVFATTGVLGRGGIATSFMIEFTWLGSGQPGAQDFKIWDPQSFDLKLQGRSVPTGGTVPEPGTYALLAMALLAALASRAASNTRSRPAAVVNHA